MKQLLKNWSPLFFPFLGILCLFFSLAPYFLYRIFNIGSAVVLLLGGFFLVFPPLFPRFLFLQKSFPCLFYGLAFFFILAIALFLCLNIWMIKTAYFTQPEKDHPATLLVLGCHVNGTTPSLTLQRRLEVAAIFLKNNENALCIVSGGQGEGEDISEAEAMKTYLLNQGILSHRIYLEPNSYSTQENIENSYLVLVENKLPSTVVLITDGFHQLRGRLLWQQAAPSLPVFHQSSQTPFILLPIYWFRDLGGVVLTLFSFFK